MVMAQLHGKLPSADWISREDLLTGMVLGTLKNLDSSIVRDVFRRAVPLHGSEVVSLGASLSWTFWPAWLTCEPDVVVEDDENLVVVEVKLYSDFGPAEDEDRRQLQREWKDGSRLAGECVKRFWLLTLTNHASLPRHVIEHQLSGSYADRKHVLWLNWFEVGRALQHAEERLIGSWRGDLLDVLGQMGLAPFDGFGRVASVAGHLLLGGIHWTSRTVFTEFESPELGFAVTFERLARLDPMPNVTWGPRRRAATHLAVGFGRTLDELRHLNSGGSIEWQLSLT
jgi:hypothetical protein